MEDRANSRWGKQLVARWRRANWAATVMWALWSSTVGFTIVVPLVLAFHLRTNFTWTSRLLELCLWWGFLVIVYRVAAVLVGHAERPALPSGPEEDLEALLDAVVKSPVRPVMDARSVPKLGGPSGTGGAVSPVRFPDPEIPARVTAIGNGVKQQIAVDRSAGGKETGKIVATGHAAGPGKQPREAQGVERGGQGKIGAEDDEGEQKSVSSGAKGTEDIQLEDEGVLVGWMKLLAEATGQQMVGLLRKSRPTVYRWIDREVKIGSLVRRGSEGKGGWFSLAGHESAEAYPGGHRWLRNETLVTLNRAFGKLHDIECEHWIAEGVRADASLRIEQDGHQVRVYVEADSGTEREKHLKGKVKAYAPVLKKEASSVVLFVAKDEAAAKSLAAALGADLEGRGDEIERMAVMSLSDWRRSGKSKGEVRTLSGAGRTLLDVMRVTRGGQKGRPGDAGDGQSARVDRPAPGQGVRSRGDGKANRSVDVGMLGPIEIEAEDSGAAPDVEEGHH